MYRKARRTISKIVKGVDFGFSEYRFAWLSSTTTVDWIDSMQANCS